MIFRHQLAGKVFVLCPPQFWPSTFIFFASLLFSSRLADFHYICRSEADFPMIQYSIQLVWNQKELEFSKNSSQPLKVNQSRRKSRRRSTNEDHGRHQYVIYLHFMSYAWSCIISLDNVNSVCRQVKLLSQGTCQFLVEEFDPLEDSWSISKFSFLIHSFQLHAPKPLLGSEHKAHA